MKSKWKYITHVVKSADEVAKALTEEDFKDAPITEEPDGDYQMLEIHGTTYYRNIESGEIDY